MFVEHIRTNFMIVDPFTKGLLTKVFHGHMTRKGLVYFDDMFVFHEHITFGTTLKIKLYSFNDSCGPNGR